MKLREVYGILHNEDKYSNTRHKIQEILYEFCKPKYVRICIYLKKPKVEHAYLWVSDVKIRKTGEGNYSLFIWKGQWQCNLSFSSCACLLLWKHSHFLTCTIAFCYGSPFSVSFRDAYSPLHPNFDISPLNISTEQFFPPSSLQKWPQPQ